jgi:hypothetical protein
MATKVMPKQRYVTLHERGRSFSHVPRSKTFLPFNGHIIMFSFAYFPVPIGATVCCNAAHLQNPEEIKAPLFFNV